MRFGLDRWAAAACTPLALFAVTACGASDGSGAKSPVDGRSVSATDDSDRDTSGRDFGENPSRDSGSRSEGAVGESAGPGGLGPEDGRVGTQWPADDVAGAVPRAGGANGPGSGSGSGSGSRSGSGRGEPVQLTYEAGGAKGFVRAIRAGAATWDEEVPEIELVPAGEGTEADIRIVATKGWPGAYPQGPALGKGTIAIGSRALAQGHDAVRIVSHELGHMLGLEDDQPGPCSSVMSGKSAGTACTNANPNPAEVREVRRNFGFKAVVG
jgi:hypothetical protein